MANGEWGMGSGEWGVGNGPLPHSLLTTPHSPSSAPRLEVGEEEEEVLDRDRSVGRAGARAIVKVDLGASGFETSEKKEKILDGDGLVAVWAVGEEAVIVDVGLAAGTTEGVGG